MDYKIIDILENKWQEKGYVYSTKERVLKRIKHFEKYCCPLLYGKNVIEFACNAGIFGLIISENSNSYIGVEPNKTYIMQASITKEYMAKEKTIEFKNASVLSYFKNHDNSFKYDAAVMNFCLYRFSDKEISLIEKKVLSECDIVCIQNRTTVKERIKNRYGFRGAKNIVEWLRKFNFDCRIIWGDKEKSFSCIIGEKK